MIQLSGISYVALSRRGWRIDSTGSMASHGEKMIVDGYLTTGFVSSTNAKFNWIQIDFVKSAKVR